MDQRKLESIKRHLQKEDVKRRIQKDMLYGHDNATVTISRASELSGLSVNQLRDWEKKGLLKPLRTEASDGKRATGQRQYSISELDKLAIIRELINANFSPGTIPINIDEIWSSTVESDKPQPVIDTVNQKFLPLNIREDNAYLNDFFWRFYASHALQLTLMLVSEDAFSSYAGLILPARENYLADFMPDAHNLSAIGESLICYLGKTRSFRTLLTPDPSFEYPSDFRVLPLSAGEEYKQRIGRGEDHTLIFVQRDEVKKLNLTKEAVEMAKSLLRPLYEDRQDWQKYFGEGVKDLVDPGTDFMSGIPDMVLIGAANMIVRLGGKKEDGQGRWRFCYILLPENPSLLLQQQSLVVRAMSENIRHAIGAPEHDHTSLSVRAFQSGHIMYRQELSERDIPAGARAIEKPVRSNIAVPIGGEMGETLGVIYVVSYDTHAFSEQDCRVLRIVARMVEELLSGYAVRRQLTRSLAEVVKEPETVDPSFREFGSENDFISDIEEHLERIKEQMTYDRGERVEIKSRVFSDTGSIPREISFIAIDIDNQDFIVRDYDERTLRNLQKTIGQRIRDLLPAFFTRYVDCSLYHIYSGRFYLFLRDFSLEASKRNAVRLKDALEGNIAIMLPDVLGRTIIVPNISLHLAVGWYSYGKLKEFLETEQYHTIADVSSTIYRSLDSLLKLGMDDGGNVIYAWDPETATFGVYPPFDAKR